MKAAPYFNGKLSTSRLAVFLRFLRRAVPLDLEAWSFADGLRAATACALPVLIAEMTGIRTISWIAIMAFWGCLADTGGAWRSRFVSLAGFTVFATLGCFLALVSSHSFLLSVIFAIVWSFGFSMMRVFGGAAGTVGNLLVISILVSLSMPSPTLQDTALRTGLSLAGALWAMALVLVIWRIYPHRPARRAVGQVWHALAQLAEMLAHESPAAEDLAKSSEAWISGVKTARGRVRNTIETARNVIASRRRQQSGRSSRGELILVMLADADETFEALIVLSELLDPQWDEAPSHISPAVARSLRLALHRVSRQADAIAATLQERTQRTSKHPGRAIERFRRQLVAEGAAPGAHYAATLLARIADYLTVASSTLAGVSAPRELGEAIAEKPLEPLFDLRAAWATLRANLTFGSLTFRHALRVAVTAGVGEAIISACHIRRGYWLVLTSVVVLQPFLAATWRRAFERAAGSVLGGLVAAAISIVATTPLEITAAVFPLSIIAMAFRQVNYAIFTFWLTPQFVLIAELFQTGNTGDIGLAGLRALYSTIGGTLGLAAALLLWPSRELPLLPKQLASMIRLHAGYLEAALEEASGRGKPSRSGSPAALAEARRKVGLASNNVEAALQRLLSEPHWHTPPEAEPAMTIITCARRLAGASAAISLGPVSAGEATLEVKNFMVWVHEALDAIAAAIEAGEAPPPLLPASELPHGKTAGVQDLGFLVSELDRIRRQTEVTHGAAGRLVQGKKASAPENVREDGQGLHRERASAARP